MLSIDVKSEIGHLEGVILHTPGAEIEKMTPSTIKESLYSDLLNLNIAQKEYKCFEGVLSKWTKTYQVLSLLT
ncbi:MAG: arginine deiminase, partial [Bacteroidales bacterium]